MHNWSGTKNCGLPNLRTGKDSQCEQRSVAYMNTLLSINLFIVYNVANFKNERADDNNSFLDHPQVDNTLTLIFDYQLLSFQRCVCVVLKLIVVLKCAEFFPFTISLFITEI